MPWPGLVAGLLLRDPWTSPVLVGGLANSALADDSGVERLAGVLLALELGGLEQPERRAAALEARADLLLRVEAGSPDRLPRVADAIRAQAAAMARRRRGG